MRDNSRTFDSVTTSILKVLKEDLLRTDGTLESYSWKWNRLKRFMETHNLQHLTADVCDNFLLSVYGAKDFSFLIFFFIWLSNGITCKANRSSIDHSIAEVTWK